ncbi:CHASE2 domain-containing protein, partial [bacterium]|nr:CHASE2 domain-containing protein [bacterium]
MKIFTGYLSRYLICALTGLLLVVLLNIKNFDLHFILRGTQNLSSDIIIAHVPLEPNDIEIAVTEISKRSPQLIVAPVSRKTSILLNSYKNILLIPHKSLKADADGAIRTFNIPHALLNKVTQNKTLQNSLTPSFINFRGPQNSFPSIYFYEIKNQKILPTTIRKKIIILDLQDPEDESFATPVGDLTGAELIANIIDNLLLERWITPIPIWISGIVILFLTFLVSSLILSLSANLAFLGIFIIVLLTSSFTFLLFDQFYIWLPLTSFLIQIFVSYFVFVNYKLNKKEQFAWRLEKEKIYKDEMEEMKKNFLNLFSHDLKTPIAKILGQIEILEGSPTTPPLFKEGLTKIRKYSYELNQYVKN